MDDHARQVEPVAGSLDPTFADAEAGDEARLTDGLFRCLVRLAKGESKKARARQTKRFEIGRRSGSLLQLFFSR